MKSLEKITINENSTTLEALAKINEKPPSMTLFVVNGEGQLKGTLTDGDVRRGLLSGKDIHQPVSDFMKKNFSFLREDDFSVKDIQTFRKNNFFLLPVLDMDNRVKEVFDLKELNSILPVDVVIMAGGLGSRLKPLTDNKPKPLLQIGEKPIIEHNIDRLKRFGIRNIHISVKYLGEQIEEYFGDGSEKDLSISYIHENMPLGTFGAVSLVEKYENDDILVMNSDVLTNIDFEDFYLHFKETGALMSVATSPYTVKVPYGIMETNKDIIKGIKEKPTLTFYSNAGIYLVKKEVLKYIPQNVAFNAPDLMEIIMGKGDRLIHYPILGYWLDIGKPEDFVKAQEDIKHLKF